MTSRHINLADLADEPLLPEARVSGLADNTPRSIRIDHVAPNPLNTRDVTANRAKISEIADSMREHGQLQPCPVVTRDAFLAIFPEYEEGIGTATHVQVMGARRRAGAIEAGLPTLDITVKNNLASSRAEFVAATAAENIDREGYDPIEEAKAIQLVVREAGSGKAAAARLARTPGWISQRQALLKLTPEMQDLVSAGRLPIRVAREIGAKIPPERQMGEWRRRLSQNGVVADDDSAVDAHTDQPSPPKAAGERPKRTPQAAAIRRLGGTPSGIATALRTELDAAQLKELIDLLLVDERSTQDQT